MLLFLVRCAAVNPRTARRSHSPPHRPWPGVLPPFLLLLVLSFNTLLPLKHITNRITVAGSVLVSAVMYHANLENQTPPVFRPIPTQIPLACNLKK